MSLISAVSEQSWTTFRKLVQERFPHATLYGLRVEWGVVVGYDRVRFTRIFDREAVRPQAFDGPANERWDRFISFCAGIADGRLPEVHFRDGDPSLAQFEEPGAEFLSAHT